MTKMIGSVYDAFRATNGPDEKARAAVEDLAQFNAGLRGLGGRVDRVASKVDALERKFDGEFTLLQWMVGANAALTVAVTIHLLVP